MQRVGEMLVSGARADLVQEIIAEATGALVDWLREEWISAQGGVASLQKAQIEVTKDWYGPFWSVRFTVDGPPWFGDSITIEVEEIGPGAFRSVIGDPSKFHNTNIECDHPPGAEPKDHWKVNEGPRPRPLTTVETKKPQEPQRVQEQATPGKERSFFFFTARPRDLGWADSRHWMEEE